jgi:hypothetical protein
VNDPVHASYLLSGATPESAFAALLDVRGLPQWALGLRRARVLDAAGESTAAEVRPRSVLEFTLSAAGLTHRVLSTVTVLEAPHRLEWRYTAGATGRGGWLVEEAGEGTVRMTLTTDYEVEPEWLNTISHRPFFRGLIEQLLRRSMRRLGERLA